MKYRTAFRRVIALLTVFACGCTIFGDTDEILEDSPGTNGTTNNGTNQKSGTNNGEGASNCDFLGTDVGVCSEGVLTSSGNCLPPIGYETVEVSCDGLDNDCNGDADRNCPCEFMETTDGVCASGVTQVDGSCGEPDAFEDPETSCDEVDNDCDGVVDEGCECIFGEELADDDDDGVCTSVVADDGSCTIPPDYESSEQTCDGLDNDCDGETDEDLAVPCDDAGEGVCANAFVACSDGDPVDCGAQDFGPNYANEETGPMLCDGLDNDCDGAIDEGCPCNFNDTAEGVCGTAARDMAGACAPPTDFFGDESACATNNMNNCCDGSDNDCDGTIDEGCSCISGAIESCGSNVGECSPGTQECVNNMLGDCMNAVGPVPELCDGLDNDCDGVPDEQLRIDCVRQQGVCAGASISCDPDNPASADQGYQCNTEQLLDHDSRFQADETLCDGVDNDCDGAIDEECPCEWEGSPVGVCGNATNDQNGMCSEPLAFETEEDSCDDVDNDCDGVTDENCQCNYLGSSEGVCSDGTVSPMGGACVKPPTYNSNDATCDGLDNDCNGEVDDDAPSSESNCADGKDNDCDRQIDCEDSDCRGKVCDAKVIVVQSLLPGAAQDMQSVDSKTCQDGSCK